MFVCGVMLLATAALLANFLQNIMGYPILAAGWLLGMRGIGMALAMPFAGRSINRIGPRLMIAAGLTCNAISLYYTTGFSPDTQVWTIVWTSMLQGAGLAFLFVPLNTIGLATLPASLRTEGHRHVDADPQPWEFDWRLGGGRQFEQQDDPDARQAGRKRDALQSGFGGSRGRHARPGHGNRSCAARKRS